MTRGFLADAGAGASHGDMGVVCTVVMVKTHYVGPMVFAAHSALQDLKTKA